MRLQKSDFAGGLLAGMVTGLGIGLLLAPRRGPGANILGESELGRRASEAAPLIFEVGLLLLAQVRPVVGRVAWAVVSLAGRNRPRTRPS